MSTHQPPLVFSGDLLKLRRSKGSSSSSSRRNTNAREYAGASYSYHAPNVTAGRSSGTGSSDAFRDYLSQYGDDGEPFRNTMGSSSRRSSNSGGTNVGKGTSIRSLDYQLEGESLDAVSSFNQAVEKMRASSSSASSSSSSSSMSSTLRSKPRDEALSVLMQQKQQQHTQHQTQQQEETIGRLVEQLQSTTRQLEVDATELRHKDRVIATLTHTLQQLHPMHPRNPLNPGSLSTSASPGVTTTNML